MIVIMIMQLALFSIKIIKPDEMIKVFYTDLCITMITVSTIIDMYTVTYSVMVICMHILGKVASLWGVYAYAYICCSNTKHVLQEAWIFNYIIRSALKQEI